MDEVRLGSLPFEFALLWLFMAGAMQSHDKAVGASDGSRTFFDSVKIVSVSSKTIPSSWNTVSIRGSGFSRDPRF